MTRLASINHEGRLYNIKESGGYSCLGFDVLESRIIGYSRHLARHGIALPFKRAAAVGTTERFNQYEATFAALVKAPPMNETFYDSRTPAAVVEALEKARLNGWRVRLFYGDPETGRAWTEENDVIGTIGRSMGPIKIPLLIANARSLGGPGILDSSIVAIITGPGCFIYRHPGFDVGQWAAVSSDLPDYVAAVTHNGKIHARFKTELGARRYLGFMRGERMSK